LQKRKKGRFSTWNERVGVMDDENGESMEPMEEVDETYREKNL